MLKTYGKNATLFEQAKNADAEGDFFGAIKILLGLIEDRYPPAFLQMALYEASINKNFLKSPFYNSMIHEAIELGHIRAKIFVQDQELRNFGFFKRTFQKIHWIISNVISNHWKLSSLKRDYFYNYFKPSGRYYEQCSGKNESVYVSKLIVSYYLEPSDQKYELDCGIWSENADLAAFELGFYIREQGYFVEENLLFEPINWEENQPFLEADHFAEILDEIGSDDVQKTRYWFKLT